MKARTIILLVLLIIAGDQTLKFWVKTHMPLSRQANEYTHEQVSPYDNGIKLLGDKAQIWGALYTLLEPTQQCAIRSAQKCAAS